MIKVAKEDRSLILRRGRQTIRRVTARLPKVFKIPEPLRNCQRRVKKGSGLSFRRGERGYWSHAKMSEFVVLGISLLCGMWWLSFPNSAIRFYQRFYGSRFSPRPLFIRRAGGVWIAVALWMFWLRIPN